MIVTPIATSRFESADLSEARERLKRDSDLNMLPMRGLRRLTARERQPKSESFMKRVVHGEFTKPSRVCDGLFVDGSGISARARRLGGNVFFRSVSESGLVGRALWFEEGVPRGRPETSATLSNSLFSG